MNTKLYPDSGVELRPFISRNYDKVMNVGSLGFYGGFIKKAIADMGIRKDDAILDLGCGTGRNALVMSRYLKEKGSITGIDISDVMGKQFSEKFKNDNRVEFINKRIDKPFDIKKRFDKVLISFVIHGFPKDIRHEVISNAFTHLKPCGVLYILDYAEFDIDAIPLLHRAVFKAIECKYAFDFIRHDWKSILGDSGFFHFDEHFYLKKYIRLLKAGTNEC